MQLFLHKPCLSSDKELRVEVIEYSHVAFQVVDARAGPSLKTTLKPKKMKTLSGSRMKSNQISKLQKEFKRHSKLRNTRNATSLPKQLTVNWPNLDNVQCNQLGVILKSV